MASISVPIALIVGVTPKRIADQMRTGSGCGDSPVVKNESTKSSNDEREHEQAGGDDRRPQRGQHDEPQRLQRVAPRSIAACSTSGCSDASRARTTTVT